MRVVFERSWFSSATDAIGDELTVWWELLDLLSCCVVGPFLICLGVNLKIKTSKRQNTAVAGSDLRSKATDPRRTYTALIGHNTNTTPQWLSGMFGNTPQPQIAPGYPWFLLFNSLSDLLFSFKCHKIFIFNGKHDCWVLSYTSLNNMEWFIHLHHS